MSATLTSVTVSVDPSEFTGTLTCIIDLTQNGFSPFNTATLSSPNSCTFSGGTTGDALPPDNIVGIQFGYPDAPFEASMLDITVASTTPEPASLTLIGTGLVALVARSKKLWSKLSSS